MCSDSAASPKHNIHLEETSLIRKTLIQTPPLRLAGFPPNIANLESFWGMDILAEWSNTRVPTKPNQKNQPS